MTMTKQQQNRMTSATKTRWQQIQHTLSTLKHSHPHTHTNIHIHIDRAKQLKRHNCYQAFVVLLSRLQHHAKHTHTKDALLLIIVTSHHMVKATNPKSPPNKESISWTSRDDFRNVTFTRLSLPSFSLSSYCDCQETSSTYWNSVSKCQNL